MGVNLLKQLPEKFDLIKEDMIKDMSNAFYNANATYEGVIKDTEEKVSQRGLNTLYMSTNISEKHKIHALKKEEAKPIKNSIDNKRDVKKEILDIIRNSNPKLTGDIMDHVILKKKIKSAGLCKFCLEHKCRKNQKRLGKKPNCKIQLNNLDLHPQSKIDTKNDKQQEKNQTKIQENDEREIDLEKNTIETPEDSRFEEIPEEIHIDVSKFIQECKKEGPPALYNYSAQLIKRDYIMEPQPNPLQELQIKEKEKYRETNKKEKEFTEQPYIKTINQPEKMNLKKQKDDNQIKPKTDAIEPRNSKLNKTDNHESNVSNKTEKLKLQNTQQSQKEAMKLKDSKIKTQEINETMKQTNETQFDWKNKKSHDNNQTLTTGKNGNSNQNNQELSPKLKKEETLLATIVTKNNSRKSPEKQLIKHKDPQCDKPEIIQNNPAEIKQQDKIRTIEIKQNTVNKEQKY